MKRSTSGFTIVELLIVIIVIAILAVIAMVAYNGIQSRARDSDRKSDIVHLQKKLSVYYALNGSYPNSSQMENASFRANSLDITNDGILRPSISSGVIISYCWPGNINRYCYIGTGRPNAQAGDCSGYQSGAGSEACTGYIINYVLESAPTTEILATN